jgi:hypothetical protein
MEMKLNINDEWVDNIIVAKLKSDYDGLFGDFLDDEEEMRTAIVKLMSYYMTYEDYFEWREEVCVPADIIGAWDRYKQQKENDLTEDMTIANKLVGDNE